MSDLVRTLPNAPVRPEITLSVFMQLHFFLRSLTTGCSMVQMGTSTAGDRAVISLVISSYVLCPHTDIKKGSSLNRPQLEDHNSNVIAFYRPTRPVRYNLGEVYGELHFCRTAGAGIVVCSPSTHTSAHLHLDLDRCTLLSWTL